MNANGWTRGRLLALTVCAILAGCGGDDGEARLLVDAGGDDAASGDAGVQLDFGDFDRALEQAIAEYNGTAAPDQQVRGASAVVVHKERGVVHQRGYGEFAADRLYLVASASKILSAGVLMRLADQGKLALDAPISTYLSAWGQSVVGDVTTAQLLSGSSGLASLDELTTSVVNGGPYITQVCQYFEQAVLAECAKTIYTGSPARPVDTTFRYGGSQWHLAGALAEVVSGKSWRALVQETYVTPCDVPSLGYTNVFLRGGTGYLDFMASAANLPATDNPSIEGGAYVTAPDYGKLLLMHLRGGTCRDERVLSEEAVARMRQNRIAMVYGGTTNNALLPGYGLGWWIDASGRVLADPGLYGTYPVLDIERGYGVIIALERTTPVGAQLMAKVKPTLDGIFDALD